MFSSIRWRILIPYTLLILISLTGLGIYLSNLTYQSQLGNLENRLLDNARIISDALIADLANDLPAGEINLQAIHWAEILEARVTIIDEDGSVLGESHTDPLQMDNHLKRQEIQGARSVGFGSSLRFSQTVQYDLLYVAVPILHEEKVIGYARVSLPLEDIETQRTQFRRTVIIGSVVTSFFAVLLSIFIATLVTRPIRLLTQEAQQITKETETRYLSTSQRDEVGQLTKAFNALVKKLHTQIAALQSEQGTLTAMLQQMTDGVIIVNESGRLTLINSAAERLFDTQETNAIGRSIAEVIRQHQLIELWQRCTDTGEEQFTDLELPRIGTFIQCIAIPLGEALPEHILMLFQDLTRIRRLETVRRDFISNISHELRTPLASLKALTETLRTGALEDPPAARRFLYRMETEVDALSHMVSELLELTRIESGQVPLKLKAVAPKKLLTKAKERLGVQAERDQLKIILECPKNIPRVRADRPRLGQVLVNLLHNAIKFTAEGGQITLAARQQGNMIQFSVHDTGAGIPSDDLPRIFERFYKTDPARSSGGTGLGLAIARHLVEAHGGRIWADSVEGSGSSFYFTIPIA